MSDVYVSHITILTGGKFLTLTEKTKPKPKSVVHSVHNYNQWETNTHKTCTVISF